MMWQRCPSWVPNSLTFGVAADMFEALAKADINIHISVHRKLRFPAWFAGMRQKKRVQAIHEKFELGRAAEE